MARRGPNPRPGSERTRTGRNTFNKTVAGTIEPPAPVVPPLSLSPVAQEFWDENAPYLIEMGWLTPRFAWAFAALASNYAHLREIDEQIKRDGLVLRGPRGREYQHPLLRVSKQFSMTVLAGLREFGMTPASRQRMPKPPEKPSDDDRRFFGTAKPKKYFDD